MHNPQKRPNLPFPSSPSLKPSLVPLRRPWTNLRPLSEECKGSRRNISPLLPCDRTSVISRKEGYNDSVSEFARLEEHSSRKHALEKTTLTLRKGRFRQLAIFLALESVWLGLGLIAHSLVIRTPADRLKHASIARSFPKAAVLIDSSFHSFAIAWQTFAAIWIVDFVQEVYSGEWWALLQRNKRHGKVAASELEIDRVSVLTAGRITQANHAFREHSTFRYKAAFIVAALAVALRSLAPNSINIANRLVLKSTTIQISMLKANLTQSGDAIWSGPNSLSLQHKQISLTKKAVLSQRVRRFEYLTQIEHSLPDFEILNNDATLNKSILFGMPPRSLVKEYNYYLYPSDAVTYDFDCQWLPPELQGNLSSGGTSGWSFGGDMEGVFDYEAYINPPDLGGPFGIYPLNIISGAGARNGSIAWLIFSLTDRADLELQVTQDRGIFIDLSQIPVSQKNIGFNNWTAVVTQTDDADELVSTSAYVLFCDLHMHISSVQVEARNLGVLNYSSLSRSLVGNLDWDETSRMLGRGLNGIPWDPIAIITQNHPSRLSQFAAELLFEPPQISGTGDTNYSVYTPQGLSNISASLNNYTFVSGLYAFLDGSVGVTAVNGSVNTSPKAFVISWQYWYTNLSLVLTMSILIVVVTVRDSIRQERLIPLTLGTVKQHMAELP